MAPKVDRNPPSARRARRVALALYVALSAAFIALATWQVEKQVFAGPPVGNRATEPQCSYAIVAFEESVTHGLALAAEMRTREKADAVFEDKTATTLSAVEKRCTGNDLPALAAASRMREVAETALDNEQIALAPLRTQIKALANP